MLLNIVQGRGGGGDDDQCDNITTTFDIESGFVYINNSIIGIPNGEEVEIECDCLGPRKASAEWSYNNINVNTTRNEDNPSSPYVQDDGSSTFLKINSFAEKSSGVYTCSSRDRTESFNLTWYDPGKFGTN